MSKITGISDGVSFLHSKRTGKAENSLFQKSLNEALEKNMTEKVAGLDALGEVRPPAFKSIENESTGIADQTSRLLDHLDHYAKELENPRKTLRDIEPLIVSIQEDAVRLMASAEESQGQDSDLKDIAAQCALTANMEYIKFTRGDYS